MTEVDAAAVVAEFYAASRAGDLDRVRAVLAPEATLIEPDSVPYGGVHRGPEAIIALAVDLFSKYYDFARNEVRYILSEGENAIARVDVSGTTRTSGKPIAFSATECFVVRDGLITEIQPYHFDTAAVNEALSTD
ncbi:MAG TPA: nuclear transport factor 2 family protein [Pseudonocardia sp.]|jgi:ketosteroid isomerase-like protein|nr:nuclear transport factor 2 family protein [Pseudonocardia sp.]